MKQYEKLLMQQNEVYTLYKNYTSDIMQALKEKIDENKKLKEKININEKEIDSLKNQIIIKDKGIDNQYKKIQEFEQKAQGLKSESIIKIEECEEDIIDEIESAYLRDDKDLKNEIREKISKIEEGFKGISLNKIKKAKDKLYSFNEKEDLLDFLTNYKLSDDLIDEKQVNSLLFISLFYGILADVLRLSPYLKEYINVKKDILVLLRLMYSEKKVKSNEMVSIPVKKFISHKGSILNELDDVIRDKVITLINEMYKCYSDYAVMYNKGIDKCPNDNFEVKNREIFIKVKKDNEVKYICTPVNACIKCNLPYINNKKMKKLSNYLNEYSFVIKELQIKVEESKEEIKSKRIKEYENIISSFRIGNHLESLRYLNELLGSRKVIARLNKIQLTTLLFITYYLKGRNYTPSELLRNINFTDTDYEKHIYDKLINLNDFRNYLDVYKNKLILIDDRVKDKIIRELQQSALRINEQKNKVSTNDLGNNLNEESELKKLGYSSSLSRVERWNILKNKAIPKLGKVKVESHIRWLIKMNINRANRSNAVNEWQYDLEKLLKMK